MIDEGRQELINSLYVASDDRWSDAGRLCKEAAEEIERLAALAPPRPDASAGLIEAAEELCDLMDDVVQGNYKPDSFTTQPLRNALRARADDLEARIDNLERRSPW